MRTCVLVNFIHCLRIGGIYCQWANTRLGDCFCLLNSISLYMLHLPVPFIIWLQYHIVYPPLLIGTYKQNIDYYVKTLTIRVICFHIKFIFAVVFNWLLTSAVLVLISHKMAWSSTNCFALTRSPKIVWLSGKLYCSDSLPMYINSRLLFVCCLVPC